jgi:hypothetical protein
MSADLVRDREDYIRDRVFPFPKDEIEEEINQEIIDKAWEIYNDRQNAYEFNMENSAKRGASNISGWYNPPDIVKMGSNTAPFRVRHPILAVMIGIVQFLLMIAFVLALVVGLARLFL